MAQLSYEDYLKMNNNSKPQQQTQRTPLTSVSYFYLSDDGDEAIVRFNVENINDINVYNKHNVKVSGKNRNVQCLRGVDDSVDACPLCAQGNKPSFRVYIPLLSYDAENNMEPKACIWDQPARFRETLKSYALEYGNLKDFIFKIVRHGKKGDTNTTYSILPANPQIYKPDVLKADFSAFETFDLNKAVLLNKSFEDLQVFVETGEFPTINAPIKDEKPVIEEKVEQPKPTYSYGAERTTYINNNTEQNRPRRYTY